MPESPDTLIARRKQFGSRKRKARKEKPRRRQPAQRPSTRGTVFESPGSRVARRARTAEREERRQAAGYGARERHKRPREAPRTKPLTGKGGDLSGLLRVLKAGLPDSPSTLGVPGVSKSRAPRSRSARPEYRDIQDFSREWLVGKNLAQALRGERPESAPWAVAEGALWGTGPLKAAGAIGKGTKALLTGKGTKAAAKAAREGHRAPIRSIMPKKPAPPRAAPGAAQALPVPEEKPVVTSPEIKVREALGPARARRAAQEGLYREERARRIGQAGAASEAAEGGVAGHRAAKAQLRGELPKVQFSHLREGRLGQDELDQLFRTVQEHPELRPYEKLHTQQGLLDAFERGRVPQKSQIKLLQTVFGQDAAVEIARLSRARRAGQFAIEALNVPRSLMSSMDVSAPFRQGLVAGARHPRIFYRSFKKMFHALGSERAYKGILDEIHSRPTYPQMEEAGVKFTELGRDLTKREEQFMSNMAERIPIVGPVVHASGRAYTGFLDKMRADMFDRQLELARNAGVNVEDRRQLRGIARLVNNATGRGDLGPMESWAPAATAIFFSPRLIASRVNLLNPVWYATLPPHARKEALRAMIGLGSAAGLLLSASAYFGGKVGTDPRSADFAKLRVGNTRVDVLGGFQQYVRFGSQMATGKIVSSTTGETMTLGPGMGQMSREDIFKRFATGKFAPPASFVDDFFKGTDFEGEPFDVKTAVLKRMIPFVVQDTAELYGETDSVPLALLGFSIASVGFTTQTYSRETYFAKQAAKIKGRHDDYAGQVLDIVKKAGLTSANAKALTPQMQRAIQLRSERFAFRAERGAKDLRSKYEADALFLASQGIGTEAQAKQEARWAKAEKRDWIVRHRANDIFGPYFDQMYGDAISDLRQLVRARGYDLPTLR
jgi:hypothetical protein